MELEGLRLGVPALSAELERHQPRRADLNLDLEVAEIQITGPQTATLSGLRLAVPELAADELAPDSRRTFGWAGTGRLHQELTVEHIQVPGQATLANLAQDLTLTAALDDPAVRIQVPRLRLSARVGDMDMLPARPVPLQVDLQIPTVTLRGTAPADVDLEGLVLRAELGDALTARLGVSARSAGAGAAATDGELTVDLKLLSRLVPPELLREAELIGRVSANWEARGRLPSEAETADLRVAPAALLGRAERLPFVDGAELRVSLDGVGVGLPLDPGRVAVGGLFTEPELRIEVGPRGATLGIAGGLDLRWIEELPGLPRLAEPWSARLDWDGELAADASLTVQESFALAPVGVAQTLDLHLAGLEKLAAGGDSAPLFSALHGMDADLKLTAAIAENPTLTALASDVQVKGPFDAGANLMLRAGRELAGAVWMRARNAAVALPGVSRVEGLDAAVNLVRRLAIVRDTRTPGAVSQGDRYLSRAVLELPGSVPSASPAIDPTSAEDMGQPSRVALRRLQYTGGPLPLDAGNVELTFSLPGNLPHLEQFQADLLGGTVRGGLRLGAGPGTDRYHLQGSVGFTGLDAARLVPDPAPAPGTGVPVDDSEISGQLGFRVPLVPGVSALLDGIGLEGGLTHVGARTLDRVLFALDPSESNEAIVDQRRMVRLGSPRWFNVILKDGNLSTAGQVRALGVDLSLPRIERFPVSRLPLLSDLASLEPQLRNLVETLDLVSADHVAVSRDGGLSFHRGETP
jgi:hypothetical protein